ncbi:MAG TPA: hypothetical protein VLK88_03335 [Gemmatimonadales bacterium]|nr:hypothetical protein [Gemmatimonadales bacterium]
MTLRSTLECMPVCLIALTGVVGHAKAQKPDSTLLRPTVVIVKIAKDADAAYNGTYRASGVSTKCGLADYGYPHRSNSFAVIFPDDTATIAVTSVNFDADTLKSGTTVNSFYLSVGIRVGQHGTPPAYVVRANQAQFGEPGAATRTRTSNGSDSLTVKGVATKGTKVDVEMTLVCQP